MAEQGGIALYINLRINKKVITVLIVFILTMFSLLPVFTKKNNTAAVETSQNKIGIKVPIIMYHSILKSEKRLGDYVISPTEFENDLKYITEHKYNTIVVQDLINYIEKGTPLPDNPIMLTFDDGYYNNYLYALPLLKKYNCKAVISPIAYYSEAYSVTPDENPNYSHCTWDNLKEMMDSGYFEIQNHSYNLHSNSNGRNGVKKTSGETLEQYKNIVVNDISKAQNMIRENLDYTPLAFTYPFGATNDETLSVIKEMGFKCTIGCESKMNYITKNSDCLFELGRFLRKTGDSLNNILSKYN